MKHERLTPSIGPCLPHLPYEDQSDYRYTTKPMNCFVIVHAEDQQGDYDVGHYGEMLEWRGVIWDRNHRDFNNIYRLHDTSNPARVIWCEQGCLTMVPENEVWNASINPIAWLNINYGKNL
jgi:hypothetical protein